MNSTEVAGNMELGIYLFIYSNYMAEWVKISKSPQRNRSWEESCFFLGISSPGYLPR